MATLLQLLGDRRARLVSHARTLRELPDDVVCPAPVDPDERALDAADRRALADQDAAAAEFLMRLAEAVDAGDFKP